MRTLLSATLLILLPLSPASTATARTPDWPQATREHRPWTRWWWMGSAVDARGLTRALEAYRAAGFGGVEITPIYGVKGREDRFLPYLSPEWTAMLEHVLREARRLDMGVDLANTSGWPFGGPWVGDEAASRFIAHRTFSLHAGERLSEPVRFRQEALVRAVGHEVAISELRDPAESNPDLQRLALDQVRFPKEAPLLALIAVSDDGQTVELTGRVDGDGRLDWTAPTGTWRVDAVFLGWHGKMVERAGPGGEGRVIDHFSRRALDRHLERFDRAFAGRRLDGLRAFFNDSYEVDDASGQASGTPALLAEFRRRRGYDLLPHVASLFTGADDETSRRVLADYRETLSDLLLESFTQPWRAWAGRHGALVRNQAHGSPASLLDLYAASDIPETEGRDALRMRWATSAAHVAGRRLVAAEAATWLGEHYRSTLADVRRALDDFFLTGVNHVVYHGTSYAPPEADWPGWPFYAAVHFDPANPWWRDLATLNRYVTRTQSFLQAGQPANDVLLYFPLYDALSVRGRSLLAHFGGDAAKPDGSAFYAAADLLERRGYTHDFVSDRQLRALRVTAGSLRTGGLSYRTLVVPACQFVPLETFEALLALARSGATVAVLGRLPADVAGLAQLSERQARYRALTGSVVFGPAREGVREARVGEGAMLLADDLEALLARAGVRREALVDLGLRFSRRRLGSGWCHLIVNRAEKPLEDWVPLAVDAASAVLFDPMSGRRGAVPLRRNPHGGVLVQLQLEADESTLLFTDLAPASAAPLPRFAPAGPAADVAGTWTVRFVEGGPVLPPTLRTGSLDSWTGFGSEAARTFSGTAQYAIRFRRPVDAGAWRLDLGQVKDSARVVLNGREIGTLIAPPWRLTFADALLRENNRLEVFVTNLAANRVADLDRRQVPWKKFYNVNFPARLAENRGADGLFTAARWAPLDSGLLGPVTLTPLRREPKAAE